MSSNPVSVRNKSSKFTLTKKEFYNNINKIGNNAITIKNNFGSNFPSEFSQYKKTTLKKNNKINKNSNRFNLKTNNNTINKSKKDFNTLNTDFLKLFRQFDLLKKNKNSNKTAIEASLQEKKMIYPPSVSNSKSKGKNNNKNNNKNNSKQKNKNLKINSNYEPLYSNEKNITISNNNTSQRNNILTSHIKNKKINSNLQKNKIPKKTFKTFNPFHIKFAKPINALNKNKIKQSNITTYQINFSKLIPNKIHSLQNNINKTQEIRNSSKTIKNQ